MANLMEVTLISQYFNQEIVNRWNYLTSSTPAAVSLSFALASAMGGVRSAPSTNFLPGSLLEGMRSNQVSVVSYRELLVRDVYSNTDFYTTPILNTIAGSITVGDPGSPVLAYGFRTNRTRTDIRRATKRFVGVSETDMGAGGVLTTPRLTELITLAGLMSEVIEYDDEGNTIAFQPVVVKKERYVVPASGNFAYRYNEDEAQQFADLMTGIAWQAYGTVRTQTSRQYGRGI